MSIGSLVSLTILNYTVADPYSQGVPFNDTTNWRLDIIQKGQQVLGDRVLGFQAGNEPDLYVSHGRRNQVSQVAKTSPEDTRFTRT